MKRICEQCKRTIRSNSSKAFYLGFLKQPPKGGEPYEVWMCGKKCLNDYNDGEDIGHEDSVR